MPELGLEGLLSPIRVGRVLFLASVTYVGVVFFAQRVVAFPGTFRDSPRAAPQAPEGITQVWLETSFGRVESWLYLADDAPDAPTLIFSHGNGELIEDWEPAMRLLSAEGVNALTVEFPGYGHSDGKPTRETIDEAFERAYDWLASSGEVSSARIVPYGRSMGGGAAADLALARPVQALVLQSTFSSVAMLARQLLVPGILIRDPFDNARVVREFDGPVLLMHGPTDDVVPYAHAERIALARSGLEIVDLDCAHNDCGRVWPEIVATVTEFLREEGLLDQGERVGLSRPAT